MRLYAIDRLILLLAVLAVLLLGTQWLAQPAPPTLTDSRPESVNEIQVLQQDRLRLALLRDRDGWMLTHPEIQRAAAQRVAGLLGLLQTASLQRWQASSGSDLLAQFDPPVRTVRFDDLSIDFGGPSTPPGRRYVRIGDHIHLVDELWFNLTGLPADYYREQN